MPRNNNIKKVLVIGSGPIVIGQAAEFDYAGTQACRVLREDGIEIVLVNSNPATIMTDKNIADRIYIEPLTLTTVKRIIDKERPDSILSGLGGQMGLTLCMQLARDGFLNKMNVRLLGSSPETIDKAEDRLIFKETMQGIGQPVIPSAIATDMETAAEYAHGIGYPLIVRPAFTLGGSGGGIADNETRLREIAANGLSLSPIHQILVEKSVARIHHIKGRGASFQTFHGTQQAAWMRLLQCFRWSLRSKLLSSKSTWMLILSSPLRSKRLRRFPLSPRCHTHASAPAVYLRYSTRGFR